MEICAEGAHGWDCRYASEVSFGGELATCRKLGVNGHWGVNGGSVGNGQSLKLEVDSLS